MFFTGAAAGALLQATPNTATAVRATTSHHRRRRKGVIK
jgi:hypothetical protein